MRSAPALSDCGSHRRLLGEVRRVLGVMPLLSPRSSARPASCIRFPACLVAPVHVVVVVVVVVVITLTRR